MDLGTGEALVEALQGAPESESAELTEVSFVSKPVTLTAAIAAGFLWGVAGFV